MKHPVRRGILIVTLVACASGLMPTAEAAAREKGDWVLRLRGVNINPNSESTMVTNLTDASVSVDDDIAPEIDGSFMFTQHFGIELAASFATHDVQGEDSIEALNEIVQVDLIPVTVMFQYHFLNNGRFNPYIGFGGNYSQFQSEEAQSSLETALGGDTSASVDDAAGFAGQIGLDFMFGDHWFFNLDFKYLDLQTEAFLRTDDVRRRVDVDIDPAVFGVGIGYRF